MTRSLRRAIALVATAALSAATAACGSSDSPSSSSAPRAAATGTSSARATGTATQSIATLLGLRDTTTVSTPDILVLGGRDFPAGKAVRVPVAILRKDGTPIRSDGGRAELYLAPTPTAPLVGPFPASLAKIQAPGIRFDDKDRSELYVAHPTVPSPGDYFLVATYTVGGKRSSASAGIQILPREQTPPVGSRAPASDTPTIRSTGGNLAALTTATPPDRALLQHSVAESLRDHVPFTVVFATPRFCESRLCGPSVDVVDLVRRRMRGTPMRFIHVEIYTDNNPAKGPNRWVNEWRLPTEPWAFVVGADGRIRAKFEGALIPTELERAARAALAPAPG